MSRLQTIFWGTAAVVVALWIGSAFPLPVPTSFFPLRSVVIQFTGVLSMAAMSLAMILALRPRWLEPRVDGLDKIYRLHKWLGIAGLIGSILHWLWAQGSKWAVGLGWLTRPPRAPRPQLEGLEAALRGLRGAAEDIGEWAFYAATFLIVIALVKAVPYRLFARLHRVFPLAYLTLVFHSVVLLDFAVWLTPVGLLMAVLMAGGTFAAFVSLLGRIGAGRRFEAIVTEVRTFPSMGVLAGSQKVEGDWPGHKPGQFAFVTSDPNEGAHPYTIASAWNPAERSIRFITKALGDHTATLPDTVKPGMRVTIEGPYGCFTFDDHRPAQIWIGAGIGVTPFIARIEHLAAERQAGRTPPQSITFFHTAREIDPEALALLEADARRAGVTLHVMLDKRDGFLTGARIREAVADWTEASVWFCGPAGFGDKLRADFAAQGVNVARRFHQELFEMR